MRFSLRHAALSGLIVLLSFGATAVPLAVVAADTPGCDVLAVPPAVDELGLPGGFPPGEQIDAFPLAIVGVACAATNNPVLGDPVVSMTNINPGIAFDNVWYVANPGTAFSNVDGTVNGQIAFKIDTAGVNTPLIFESILADGIFAPGEEWRFIVQDYTNGLGLPPSAILAPGIPDGPSSAHIIATIATPEPGTAALLALGLTALAARRRARI